MSKKIKKIIIPIKKIGCDKMDDVMRMDNISENLKSSLHKFFISRPLNEVKIINLDEMFDALETGYEVFEELYSVSKEVFEDESGIISTKTVSRLENLLNSSENAINRVRKLMNEKIYIMLQPKQVTNINNKLNHYDNRFAQIREWIDKFDYETNNARNVNVLNARFRKYCTGLLICGGISTLLINLNLVYIPSKVLAFIGIISFTAYLGIKIQQRLLYIK